MWNYTYFVITPGTEIGTFMHYPGGVQGNFIKFGDQVSDHGSLGIRNAYATHNPDIGIAAVMHTSAFQNPGLGTLIKQFIIKDIGLPAVGNTEWFGIRRDAAWQLFQRMLNNWDGATVTSSNVDNLLRDIRGVLRATDGEPTFFVPETLKDLEVDVI